jgi:dethiobiotin synthetase
MTATDQPAPGLFITGTGTEVGKTHVGAMIARSLVASGVHVGVYKPVASGCPSNPQGELVAEDGRLLWEAAGRPGKLAAVCPQQFNAPLAPHRAAAREGRKVDNLLLRDGLDIWRRSSDLVLVEGAGGLLSPLGDGDDNSRLAADLGLPLVIVAANALGAINATRLTVLAARTLLPQLPIAAVVLNQVELSPADTSRATNSVEIAQWCNVPILVSVPYGASQFEPQVDWRKAAGTRAP